MTALLERGARGFGEALALLGRHGPGAREIRAVDVLGAHVPWAADNHWADAAVVLEGAATGEPPGTDPLPHCVWACAEHVPGRRASAEVTMPVMALDLTEHGGGVGTSDTVDDVGLDELGVLNDRAYGQEVLGPLLGALPAGAAPVVGLRDDRGVLVSAALALDVGDDSSIQWVATDPGRRRRGHARAVLERLLGDARRRGRTTATLQASPDGHALYEQLGFRTVGTLRAHLVT